MAARIMVILSSQTIKFQCNIWSTLWYCYVDIKSLWTQKWHNGGIRQKVNVTSYSTLNISTGSSDSRYFYLQKYLLCIYIYWPWIVSAMSYLPGFMARVTSLAGSPFFTTLSFLGWSGIPGECAEVVILFHKAAWIVLKKRGEDIKD